MKWDEWVGDYGLVRDLIAETYPDEFHDFNARMFTPGGFYRGNAARERIWKTKSGKAEFTVPKTLTFDGLRGRARAATGCSPCAATISSTRRSTASATGFAASKARATCF